MDSRVVVDPVTITLFWIAVADLCLLVQAGILYVQKRLGARRGLIRLSWCCVIYSILNLLGNLAMLVYQTR